MAEWSVKGTRGLRFRVFISFVLQEGFNQFCFPRQPEMLSFLAAHAPVFLRRREYRWKNRGQSLGIL
jgi:hypothetical protein